MTTLDTKALESAQTAFVVALGSKGKHYTPSDAVAYAITAYLDALSSIPERGVGVKALDWQHRDDRPKASLEAVTIIGTYFVGLTSDGTSWFWRAPTKNAVYVSTEEQAKAAAKAAYEARILSALVTPSHPAAVAVTDEMVNLACKANIHPLSEPSAAERKYMRAALEAALVDRDRVK